MARTDLERVDVERSLASGQRIADKSLLWRAFDLYLSSAVLLVPIPFLLAASERVLAGVALAFAAFAAWRSSHISDLRRIAVPLDRTGARTATVAAIRSLGWILAGDYAAYADAYPRTGFLETGRSIVVLYGDRCVLFNSTHYQFNPFSSYPREDFTAFADALEQQLAQREEGGP
jgi:hypothetical protein